MVRHPELMRYLLLRVLSKKYLLDQASQCRPWKAVLKESFLSFFKLGLQLIFRVSFFLCSTFIL